MNAVGREELAPGPRVPRWYAGRSVLVTGATGFLGRAIVEKLLRACPDIATIYLLVRPKRGLEPRERLEAYTNDVVFTKVREQHPDFSRHLCVISGDVSAPDFRLAEQDMAALRRDVSVVFHCAASVRFDLSLREAVTTNVLGTKRVLQLAEQLQNLQVFLYISTSFCNSDHQVVEEKLYPAKGDPEKIMDIVSWMDDDILESITPRLLRNLPNTYALSKNLAEELVARYSDRLPIVIARPSIVVSAWKEPLAGWQANMNGPTGFLVAAGKGVMRTMCADLSIVSDCMPVDCTANAIIVVAWHVGATRPSSPYVCNITNGDQKRVTWRDVMDNLVTAAANEVPLRPVLWYPGLTVTTSLTWYTIIHFFLEALPSHILDYLIRLSGRKPFLVNIQSRLQTAMIMLRYYVVHEWKFINKNMMSLYESLDPADQETFNFNLTELELYTYLKNGIIGAKLFLLKERMDNLPSDLRYLRRMYWLHNTVRVLFYGMLLWLLYSWSHTALAILEYAVLYLTSLFSGAPVVRTLGDGATVPLAGLPQNVVCVTNS